jgi:flagellar protein FliS
VSQAASYVQAAARTASREQLMVMLLEKALQGIRSGAAALEKGNLAAASPALARASEIAVELHATLDRSRAPELCDELGAVYRFVCDRLLRAQVTRDPRLAREAERAFAPIADAFAQAVRLLPARPAR